MKTIFVVIHHKSHTDNKLYAFTSHLDAMTKCRAITERYGHRFMFAEEIILYGDWAAVCNNFYYCSLEEVEVL